MLKVKILELIFNLEEAYHRFGDIEVKIECDPDSPLLGDKYPPIKELVIESEEFIIKCE